MPVETRISQEFGRLVAELMENDSFGQGTIRAGISQGYLLAMKRGKVPTAGFVKKFADGYKDRGADLHKLMIAAGYEQPPEHVVTADDITVRFRVEGSMTREWISSGHGWLTHL